MTTPTAPSVLIIARPGRDRRSLAALLKTLGGAEMFLLDCPISEESQGALWSAGAEHTPDLVVVDLDGLDDGGAEMLAWAARRWPNARRLALSDSFGLGAAPRSLNAHCSLARSAPAGDLLFAARRISAV